MMRRIFIIAAAAAFLAGCRNDAPKESAASIQPEEWVYARFPSDLGPALLDVSDYPPAVQQDYKLFLAACSSCHSPARALNAPLVKESDWKRYIHRMHVKMDRKGLVLKPEQERRIVNFLTYDSRKRKLENRQEFELVTEMMKQLYEDVENERRNLIYETALDAPKKETPYVGVK